MARRLFIPGTGGCFFEASDGSRVASILDLALDRQTSFICRHSEDPDALEPERTTGMTEADGAPVKLHAAGPIRAVYEPFFDAIGPATTSKLYTFFNYDWRLDIRYTGGRLREFLVDNAAGGKWDIVCHSQGGLVLTWASLLLGATEFPKLVRRVIFMGVPFQGTVNSVAGLLNGVGLVGDNLVKAEPATVRTWPSVYQMMPRWTLRVPEARGVELFQTSTWRKDGVLGAAGDTKSGVDPNLLARARKYKVALDGQNFEALRAVEKLVFTMGHNINTRGRMPAFPKLPPDERRDGDVIMRGDGLVPVDMTFKLLPTPMKDSIDSLLTPVRSHMLMCSSLAQFSQCESILEA